LGVCGRSKNQHLLRALLFPFQTEHRHTRPLHLYVILAHGHLTGCR